MSSTSSKLGLVILNIGDLVDATPFNYNFSIIDSCVGVCPLAVFPDVFYEGMNVLVGSVWYVRANNSWIPVGGVDGSLGKKAYLRDITTADTTYTTSETGPIYSSTLNLVANRVYWIEGLLYIKGKDVPDNKPVQSILRVRYATGASVTTAGTQINSSSYMNKVREGIIYRPLSFFRRFVPSTTGQYTIGVFMQVDSSINPGGQMAVAVDPIYGQRSYLFIKDMGPA